MADCYNKTLRSILDKHAPIKSKFLISRQTVHSFNDKLKKLKAKRRKLERRMIKSGLQCDKDAYHEVRNDYCTSLNETRKTYYSNMIDECAGDSQKLFRIVNSLSEERQVRDLPNENPLILANRFGEFFYKKIELVKAEIDKVSVDPPHVDPPHFLCSRKTKFGK